MAAISEVVLSNQPHASSDIGEAGILKLSMDASVLGIERAKTSLFQLFCMVWLHLYIDLITLL